MENRQNIVDTRVAYTYLVMQNNIQKLKNKYSFLQIGNIGYSVLGRPIPYVKIGKGEKEVMYSGSIHANEWIVTIVLMKFIEDFCEAYESNTNIYGYNATDIFNNTSIYIIPMVNPDGVDLVTGAITPGTKIYENFKYISNNFPNIPFPNGWKANFNGESFTNFHHFFKPL